MKRCVKDGHALNGVGEGWPRETRSPLNPLNAGKVVGDGVIDKGQVFNEIDIPGVGVGPYFESYYKKTHSIDGIVSCRQDTSKIFNLFVGILGYKSGNDMTMGSIKATKKARLEVVCNGDKPGLLQPAKFAFIGLLPGAVPDEEKDCNANNVHAYTGIEPEKQLQWIGKLYNQM